MKITCPVCKNEMTLFATTKDIQANNAKETGESYSSFECKSCDILFQYPFWAPADTAGFYENNYYAHTENLKLPRSLRLLDFYMQNGITSKLFSPFLKKKLYPYYQEIMKSKRVLDIGCGKGLFLDVMKKHNKETYGIEPSDNAKAIAIKKGHTMIDRSFLNSSEKKVKFDLITMFQVAEHLSVQEILEEKIFSGIYDSLKPGGCLVIETPNYECNYAKSFKGDWRSLELPRHLVIFSPKSIYRILKDSGFEVNVLVRVSPIDVKESFKLRYKSKSNKNRIKKFLSLCKIIMFQKRNSSLLVVVAKKL